MTKQLRRYIITISTQHPAAGEPSVEEVRAFGYSPSDAIKSAKRDIHGGGGCDSRTYGEITWRARLAKED